MPTLLESLEPGGVLVYETFGVGNEQYNTPRNPDFLLQPGELLRWCADFDIVAYEHGFRADPDHIVQRIVAVPLHAQAQCLEALEDQEKYAPVVSIGEWKALLRLHRALRREAHSDLTPSQMSALATIDRLGPLTRGYGFFLENRLRERYGLEGVPLVIDYKTS